MSKDFRVNSTWLKQPWVVLCWCFACPPIGLYLVLSTSAFRRWSRALILLVVGLVFAIFFEYRSKITEFFSMLWYSKFRQSIRSFEYQKAALYLKKVQFQEPLDQLEIQVTWLNHYWSLGENEKSAQVLDEIIEQSLTEFEDFQKSLPTAWLDGQDKAIENYLQNGEFDPVPLRGEEAPKLVLWEKKLLKKADRFVGILKGAGGTSSVETPLLYLIFTKAQPELVRKVLDALVYLHRLLPDRYSPFELDFYLLAYHIQFSSNEKLNLFEESYYQRIIVSLDEFVGQSLYNLKARYLRGIYLRRKGDLEKAIDDFLYVFKLDVRFLRVYELLLENVSATETQTLKLYRESEDLRFFDANFQASIQRSRALLKEKGKLAEFLKDEVLFNLGVIYRNNLKDFPSAVECFEKILEDEESIRVQESLYNLTMCYLFLKKYKQCENSMKELVRRFPKTSHRMKLRMLFVYLKTLQVVDLSRQSLKKNQPNKDEE